MEPFIPLSVPNLRGNELKYVSEAIKTEWVSTGGSYILKFEKAIADYVGTTDAVAVQSGTAGLHLSLRLAEVERDDAVIVPTLTFIAAVNPVRYLDAIPIFMDCDESLCMDLNKLEQFCIEECHVEEQCLIHNATRRMIKAVVVVHVFGNMPDMEKLMDIAATYHLKVIEDATEALGTKIISGRYTGRYAGTIGDFGVYSFNGNKIITTGGGGMVLSKHSDKLEQLRYLSTQAKDDELYYIHDYIGYNYRMTNLQAAVGLAQMERLNEFIHIKINNYRHYQSKVQKISGLKLMSFRENIRSNYWFYSLYIEDSYSLSRDQLLRNLLKHKIQTRPLWGLIHEQKPYQKSDCYKIDQAPHYYQHVLNIPCSTNLESEDIERFFEVLRLFDKS